MNIRKVAVYLLLSFALSWTIAFSYIGFIGDFASPMFLGMLLILMWMPAVAAIIVQRVIYKEPLADIGLTLRFNRWILVAWLLPVVFVALTIAFNGLMPNTSYDTGAATLGILLESANLPAEQLTQVQDALDSVGIALPVVLFVAFTIMNLIGGITINSLAALGEELGWRGLMQRELAPLGFWRMNLVIGIVWGLWHAPIIWQGYNYPEHPRWGVLMMVLFTTFLSPLHAHVREKSETILAPSILHGTINASGGLAIFFMTGGSDLTVGIAGAAGLIALLLLNLGLWWVRQRDAAGSLIDSAESPLAESLQL